MQFNWQKFEKRIVKDLQDINETIDVLVANYLYEDAMDLYLHQKRVLKNIYDKMETFGAYNKTIDNAYKILGYDKDDTNR